MPVSWLTCAMLAAACLATTSADAQPPAVAARQLDRRADELQAGFLKELDSLAKDYEEAGLIDRAKETLRKRQSIQKSDEVREKLDQLDELDFENNQKELTISPSRGWTDTGLDVDEGKSIRVEAKGQIRIILNLEVGPSGLELADDLKGVPAGALIAVVFPPKEGKKRPEPTAPVVIGESSQFEPSKSGRLFLRVAAPASAKSVGDYAVLVSGKFRAAGGR